MQIKAILPPPQEGAPYTLQLEDGALLHVGEGEMMDFALYTGMELSEAEDAKLRKAAQGYALRKRAIAILTARPCSTGELLAKLQEKGAARQQAEEICHWAEQIGLLSDKDYAMTIVRHYSKKGYGYYKIRDELYRRQVPRALWEAALGELPAPEEGIHGYLTAHLRSWDRKAVKKAADALARRGFSYSDITEGIEAFRKTVEESEEVFP